MVLVNAFDPSTWRQRLANLPEFKASLIYKSEFQDSQNYYSEKPCLEGGKTERKHFLPTI